MGYTGARWLEQSCKCEVSAFGRKVGDILGNAFKGIYHIHKAVMHKRVQWDDKDMIEVVLGCELATHDGSELTELVVLCHDACVRLAIDGVSNGYIKLRFTNRDRGNDFMYNHPTMSRALSRMAEIRLEEVKDGN